MAVLMFLLKIILHSKSHSNTNANSSHTSILWIIFSKRQRITLRLLYAIAISSVCRLSSVTLVRPTQPVEIFGNFLPYDSPGTLVF